MTTSIENPKTFQVHTNSLKLSIKSSAEHELTYIPRSCNRHFTANCEFKLQGFEMQFDCFSGQSYICTQQQIFEISVKLSSMLANTKLFLLARFVNFKVKLQATRRQHPTSPRLPFQLSMTRFVSILIKSSIFINFHFQRSCKSLPVLHFSAPLQPSVPLHHFAFNFNLELRMKICFSITNTPFENVAKAKRTESIENPGL